MKKWIFILFLFVCKGVYSAYYVGAEINYEIIDSSKDFYRITWSAFTECSGTVGGFVPININFSSGCPTQNVTGTFVKFNYLNSLCPGGSTSCNSPTSTNIGIRQNVVEAYVTLPRTCGFAIISFENCCIPINAGPGSYGTNINGAGCVSIYAETVINLSLIGGNNSAKILNKKFLNGAIGVKNDYNFIAEDKDNDSIVYETIDALCNHTSTYSYINGKPFFMVDPALSMNKKTGELSFTPTKSQSTIVGFKISEYRKIKNSQGKDSFILAGQNFMSYPCVINQPSAQTDAIGIIADSAENVAIIDKNNVTGCKDKLMKFKIKGIGYAGTPTAELKLTCSYLPPGSSYTYYVVKSASNIDTLYGTILFNGVTAEKNNYKFVAEIHYCSNGVRVGTELGINIQFSNPPNMVRNLSHCLGGNRPSMAFNKNTHSYWMNANEISYNSDSSLVFFNNNTSTSFFQVLKSVNQNCGQIVQYNVSIVPSFTYTLSPLNRMQTILFGESKTIGFEFPGAYPKFDWSPIKYLYDISTGLPSYTAPFINAKPIDSTKYKITMVNGEGCSITDSFLIHVNKISILPSIFIDLNSNGIKEANEPYYHHGTLTIKYGSDSLVYKEVLGNNSIFHLGYKGNLNFGFKSPLNSFNIVMSKVNYAANIWGEKVLVDIALQPTNYWYDLAISHACNQAFADTGKIAIYKILVQNKGNLTANNIACYFVKNVNQTFLGAQPNYNSVHGDTAFWTLSSLGPIMDSIIHLNVMNSNTLILGQNIVTQTSISFNGIDSNFFNNHFQLKQRITNNVSSQSKSESHLTFFYDYEVRRGEWLNYTIHFKNTTNATIQDILIIDTFPITIDPSTIEMTYSKHPYTLKQISNRIFHWDFAGIQLSNDTSNGSNESQFSFRIKPPKFYGKTIDITNRASVIHNYFQKPLPIESVGFIVETAENPTLFSKTYNLFEDSSINFCLHAKDLDSNTIFSFNIAKQGNYGAVNLIADSCFRYKPNVNFFGRDSFSMRVCDQTGLCDTKWFYTQVIPLNDTPNISSATYTSFIDSFIIFCPNISDPDSNGGLSTTICAIAINGTMLPINANCYRYTPNTGFFGKDSVCIKVCDPSGLCRQNIQYIQTIKRPFKPIITDSLIYGKEDSSILICPKIFDEDISDEFVFTLCKNAMHGVSTISNKCISYIPNKDYDDRDSICVEVCDKFSLCSSKTLHILNRESPDAPTVLDTHLLVKNNMPFAFIPKVMDADRNDVHTFSVYKKPSIGSVSFAGNTITYYPNKLFKGQEEMTILVQDKFGLNNTFLVKMQMLDASGIEEQDAQNIYRLYPNPAEEEIHVDFNSTNLSDKYWSIFNVYGAVVLNGIVQGRIGAIHATIPIRDLLSGIYFIQWKDEGGIKIMEMLEKK